MENKNRNDKDTQKKKIGRPKIMKPDLKFKIIKKKVIIYFD